MLEVFCFELSNEYSTLCNTSPQCTLSQVVTEAADGLKLNMQRIWSSTVNSTILDERSHHSAYHPCLFVLSFLHSILLERTKYGKIGWNIKYDFNDCDFNISRQLLDFYLMKVEENGTGAIPWSSLKVSAK